MSSQPRVVLILPIPYDARFRRRVHLLKEAGAKCEVFSFEREYYGGRGNDYSFHSLGHFRHGRYLDRPPKLARAIPTIAGALQDGDIVYCMGLDLLVLGALAVQLARKRCQIVYECADIVSRLYGSSWTARSLRTVERWALRHCNLIVVTSPRYVSEYFVKQQRQTSERFFLLENKVPHFTPAPKPSAPWDGSRPLRLGYFGLLRDPRAWRIMLAWAQQAPDRLQIIVRGYPFGIEGIQTDIDSRANISFGGEYIYPNDLPDMYVSIDLVWVTYPMPKDPLADPRWQWPRTNRFYEACYFGKPMIGQIGSADGAMIESHDIGLTIDTASPDDALARLQAIRPADLDRWTTNLRQLPAEVYLFRDEHRRLLATLT
jgi:succinoglycan biosynthesis protein ExoL